MLADWKILFLACVGVSMAWNLWLALKTLIPLFQSDLRDLAKIQLTLGWDSFLYIGLSFLHFAILGGMTGSYLAGIEFLVLAGISLAVMQSKLKHQARNKWGQSKGTE